MAGNNGYSEIRIKRELEEDPLDIAAIPVAPKAIRKDDLAPPASRTIQLKPIAPKPVEPDYFMLNKPPPISFNLPKEAAFANRNVQEADPMSQPPDVALKQLEEEARMIKEEVAALKWLAKRKEQEWNSILGLLKKKEETWLKVKRQAELTMNDTGFQKIKALAGVNSTNDPTPTQVHKAITSTITINTPSSTPVNVVGQATAVVDQQRKVLIPVSQPLTPQTIQALTSQGLIKSSGMTPDGKRIIVVKKSGLPSAGGQIQVSGAPIQVGGTAGQIKILPKNHAASLNSSSVKVTPIMVNKPVSTVQVNATKVVNTAPRTLVTPVTAATAVTASKAIKFCAQCKTKPSKFECGGCSKIWYCSRECQELNWDSHENECGVETNVKKEIVE